MSVLSDGLVVLSSRKASADGITTIDGEILNNTSAWKGFVEVTVRYYNSNGAFIGSEWTYADRTYIAPRQRSSFSIGDFSPPAGVARYTVTAAGDPTTGRSLGSLSLKPAPAYNDGYGYSIYWGADHQQSHDDGVLRRGLCGAL